MDYKAGAQNQLENEEAHFQYIWDTDILWSKKVNKWSVKIRVMKSKSVKCKFSIGPGIKCNCRERQDWRKREVDTFFRVISTLRLELLKNITLVLQVKETNGFFALYRGTVYI